MKMLSKEDRIAMWKFSYARSAFIDTALYCQKLLDLNPPSGDIVRNALSVAIAVTYIRPFKHRTKSLNLDADAVPIRFREVHAYIEIMRDRCIAHKDIKGPVESFGLVNQLQLVITSGKIKFNTVNQWMKNDNAEQVLDLVTEMIPNMKNQADEIVTRNNDSFEVLDGRYVMSLEDDPKNWLTEVL